MSFEEEYLVLSAEYCELLFEAARLFFSGNVGVEKCAQVRSLSTPVAFSFVDDFNDFALVSRELTATFSKFSRIHRIQDPSSAALILGQEKRLSRLAVLSNELAGKLQELDESRLLQEQLRDDNHFTDLFTTCASLICAAVEWQCSLARGANLELA